MPEFRSNEEIFQAVRDLSTALESSGHHAAAAELMTGFGYLNGLTDGWELFLDSLERTQAAHLAHFSPWDRQAFGAILCAVRDAVSRR